MQGADHRQLLRGLGWQLDRGGYGLAHGVSVTARLRDGEASSSAVDSIRVRADEIAIDLERIVFLARQAPKA
jgi:hypothetical protein